MNLNRKFESTQCAAAFAASEAWRGTNGNKLYEELDWEYLYHRRWYGRLTHFFKLRQSESPQYLYNIVPPVHLCSNSTSLANLCPTLLSVRYEPLIRHIDFPAIQRAAQAVVKVINLAFQVETAARLAQSSNR